VDAVADMALVRIKVGWRLAWPSLAVQL